MNKNYLIISNTNISLLTFTIIGIITIDFDLYFLPTYPELDTFCNLNL